MMNRCGTGPAAKHHLIAHKFTVVLAYRAFRLPVAGIGCIGALRPFPNIAAQLHEPVTGSCGLRMETPGFQEIAFREIFISGRIFPFGFRGQAFVGPRRISIRFIITDMADRFFGLNRFQSFQRKAVPGLVYLPPE